MGSTQASKVVLVTTGLMVALTLIEHHFNPVDGTLYKRLWALGLVGLGLSVLADFVPQVAGPFAVLVAIAMIARRPGILGSFIEQGSTQEAKKMPGSTGVSSTNKRYAPGSAASARPG